MKEWSVKLKAPGSKGMLSNADLLDIPPDFAKSVTNADISRELGVLRKTFGFDRHPIALLSTFPTDLDDVLSLGWMTYIQVWEGTEEVNKKMGRLYVQVNGDNAIDYYYLEYDFEDEVWVAWEGPFNENDIYGTTLAEIPIKWTPFNNVMRGALGNGSATNPLWIGYVNRNKNDDNGFFHDYTFKGNGDFDGITDVLVYSEFSKTYSCVVGTGDGTFQTSTAGYFDEVVRYIAIPVIDGHQILNLNHMVLFAGDNTYAKLWEEKDYGSDGNKRSTRLFIFIDWSDTKKNYRLTGFNLYESRATQGVEGTGRAQYGNWNLIRNIDIREGSLVSVFNYNSATFELRSPVSDSVFVIYEDNIPNYMFDELWINIREKSDGTEINERYIITSTTQTDPSSTELKFTPDGTTALVDGGLYNISIKEHWSDLPTYENAKRIAIYVDGNINLFNAPPWLPDPDKLDDDTYEHPIITCNYKHSIEFEGRHFVGDIYYDGAKRPLQVRYSNPVLDPFAGHDLFPNFIDIPSHKGDKVMGFAKTLFMYPDMAKHVLSVLTEESIFRFTFSGGLPALHETIYGVGLVAPKSLAVDDKGNWWFLGKKGKLRSVFKYDGFHEPKDIGDKRLRSEIEVALAKDGVDEEQAIGWIDKHTNKYRISIRAFQLIL